MVKKVEMEDKKFNHLLVKRENGHKSHHIAWLCLCDCGNEVTVSGAKIRNGHTKSCGCLSSKIVTDRNTTHGLSGIPEYKIWRAIQNRCLNPNQRSYPRYGGRGIKICNGWNNSFENFISDMTRRPDSSYSIDRIDTNGHYSCGHCQECVSQGWPDNCRWVTQEMQAKNRRNSLVITHDNQTLHLKDWAKIIGISYHTLYIRIVKSSWPIEIAFTTKPNSSNRIENLI